MKKIKTTCLGLFALSLGFISCQEDDSLPLANNKPVVTFASNNVTTTEGQPGVFTLNLSKAIHHSVQFRVEVVGGTAVEGVDFDMSTFGAASIFEGAFGYLGSVSPYMSSQDFSINTIADVDPEETKTVELKISSVQEAKGLIQPQIVTINIENYVADDLTASLNWSGTYLSGGVEACDADSVLDFDLELLDSGANYIQTSYSNCPEMLTILGTDADDTYTIDVSLWTNNGYNTGSVTNIPVTITFTKAGVYSETYDLSSLYPLAAGGDQDGNVNAYNTFTVIKTGNVYTVTDPNATQVVSGKAENYRMPVAQKLALKNK